MKNLAIGAALAFTLAAPSVSEDTTPKISKQMKKLLAMTPDQFARCSKLSDDSLDMIATITTEPCFKDSRGLIKVVWNDNFVRAYVDKKTGTATYQIYQFMTYDQKPRLYHTAYYETSSGPRSVPVIEISSDIGSCGGPYGDCTFVEHIAFPVDEPLLRDIARKWQPGVGAGWRFMFSAPPAQDWQDGMSVAEIAGILQAVDKYRASKGLAK